jgi:hypothetical protein
MRTVKRVGLKAIKGLLGFAVLVWFFAPISSYDGLLAFVGATAILELDRNFTGCIAFSAERIQISRNQR